MKITLFLNDKLIDFKLPEAVSGSFSFDENNEEEDKLINIDAVDNNWVLYSTNASKIIENNNIVEKTFLTTNKFYTIRRGNNNYLIYVVDIKCQEEKIYHWNDSINLKVGLTSECNLIYNCQLLHNALIKFYVKEKQLIIENNNTIPIYINKSILREPLHGLLNGDEIEILGLKIIFLPGLLVIISSKEMTKLDVVSASITLYKPNIEMPRTIEIKDRSLYKEDDFFSKAPRLRRIIETKKIKLSPPPKPDRNSELPLILTIGPMLTMGGMAGITLINTIYRISTNQATLEQTWSSIAMSSVMLISMVLWPLVTKLYNKRMKEKIRKEIEEKYSKYLDDKRKELEEERRLQKEILIENLITVEECLNIIKNKTINFWDKRTDQSDFLEVRLGIGRTPLKIEFEYPEEGFTIDEDNLRKMADKLVEEFKYVETVPVSYSFKENRLTAIMGNNSKRPVFMNNIILQLLTFYTYEDLKIVIFTDKNKERNWEFIKYLNHNFNNERNFRFFASDLDSSKRLSEYLNIVVANRKNSYDANYDKPQYFVIVDDYDLVKRQDFFKEVSESDDDLGFSLIILEDRMSKLPSKCNNFINLGDKSSGILKNSYEEQEQVLFTNEINDKINMENLIPILANIPLEFEYENSNLPNTVSFLEMEKVGKVEQLNVLNRWNMNDATTSLKAEIGIGEDGDIMYLDLHEKAHGPHGLIAGMTGSGKSELIITYVLSMAINYSPDDVAFILIDYKGGGLAFAFSNESAGLVLPHIAGTITNLDEAEMDRTLASIESEAKRRQVKFNEAKDLLGESTLDIYKYQRFYKEGKLKEAIPHLFIVCDEFAELKSQQPDFMDKLISIARIGRSLGIHLILATQKPSGVVNDQIWSNAKFHICLKVQDQQDSNEMLKKPDAALLKQTGRFYLQVGYDEYFALGQSAWCGAKYYPSEKVIKQVDKSVNFLNDTAFFIKSIQMDDGIKVRAQGEQISAIVNNVIEVAKKANKKAKRLWLDAIKPIIKVDYLYQKYQFVKKANNIEAIIGEYDAPELQQQGLLKYSFLNQGNTLIYSTDPEDFEMMLNTIIYSTVKTYSSEEINYYIFDYGSQSLNKFSKLNHVGGIVFPSDEEKYHNLFKLIKETIDKRKRIFSEYGSNYQDYIKNSGKTMPLITVILNNYDAMSDLDKNLYDDLPDLIRGSVYYGIVYIVTAIGINSVPRRIAQNFDNTYILKVKDPVDYMTTFGIRKKIVLKDIKGRGVFKDDTLHEFQTASITDESENLIEYLDKEISLINQNNSVKAKKIPELPDQVLFEDIESEVKDLSKVPIGINVNDLEINTYDFTMNFGTIITGNRLINYTFFIGSLIDVFLNIPNTQVIVLDPFKYLQYKKENVVNYYVDNFNEVMDAIGSYVNKKKEENVEQEIIIITGVSKFIEKIGDVNKFVSFLEEIKKYDKTHVIITDDILKLKKYNFEKWYQDNFYAQEGIYIGNGVSEQNILKISSYSSELAKQYKNNIGFHIQDGVYTIIKLLEFTKGEDDK